MVAHHTRSFTMLKKIILFAITSGLAKKAYDHYKQQRRAGPVPTNFVPVQPNAPVTNPTVPTV